MGEEDFCFSHSLENRKSTPINLSPQYEVMKLIPIEYFLEIQNPASFQLNKRRDNLRVSHSKLEANQIFSNFEATGMFFRVLAGEEKSGHHQTAS